MYNDYNSNDPLNEDVEVSWRIWLDRFDKVIYPILFRDRGISKDTALLVWQNSKIQDEIENLGNKLDSSY